MCRKLCEKLRKTVWSCWKSYEFWKYLRFLSRVNRTIVAILLSCVIEKHKAEQNTSIGMSQSCYEKITEPIPFPHSRTGAICWLNIDENHLISQFNGFSRGRQYLSRFIARHPQSLLLCGVACWVLSVDRVFVSVMIASDSLVLCAVRYMACTVQALNETDHVIRSGVR